MPLATVYCLIYFKIFFHCFKIYHYIQCRVFGTPGLKSALADAIAMKLIAGVLFIFMLICSHQIKADGDAEKIIHLILGEFNGKNLTNASESSPEQFRMHSTQQSGKESNSCKNCGIANIEHTLRTSIINGEDVDPPYKYPWMVHIKTVKIQKGMKIRLFCTGSIISEYYIVTAAHCVKKEIEPVHDHKDMVVSLVTTTQEVQQCPPVEKVISLCEQENEPLHDPSNVTISFVTTTHEVQAGPPVEKVFVHPQYKALVRSDIALLKLKEKIVCEIFRRPICLPPPNFVLPKDAIVTASGWGLTISGDKKSRSKILQEAKFKMDESCHFSNYTDKKMHYCLRGLNQQVTCNGDSGGPAFYQEKNNFYIIGVLSFGLGCNITNNFSYFTSIRSHLKWIYETMGSSPAKPNNRIWWNNRDWLNRSWLRNRNWLRNINWWNKRILWNNRSWWNNKSWQDNIKWWNNRH